MKLAWEGFVEVKGRRMTRLLLAARGSEKLEFAKDDHPLKREKCDEVACLPGGRPIDLACGVRYGIIGEAAAADEEQTTPERAQDIPDEARKQLTGALGGPFVVFRDQVQEDLKLSQKQKQKLEADLRERLQDAMQFFQKLEGVKPPEREKELAAYREKAREKLTAFLKETLNDGQRQRLRQVELQQEGPFVLGGEIGQELKITDEQRRQFMGVVRELRKKVEPLVKEAQSGGNPEEIRPRLMKIRREQEAKIEALLTDAQRKQWKEMLGKPLDLDE